MPSAAKSAGV